MPFKSKAQQRFMFAKHPEIAKEFADATPDISKLPEHIKKADGGMMNNAEQIEPGVYGETDPGHMEGIINALASGMAAGSAAELPLALKDLGEAGELTLGGNAPEMEGTAPKVEAFVKGIQKGPNGDVKIYGVKGDPSEIAKLGFGDDPGSIPEHILRQKGLLPDQTINIPQNAPNNYAKGGKVKGYDNGGIADNPEPTESNVDTSQLPSGASGDDWKAKLSAVLSAMGMGAQAAVAPIMPSPAAPTTPAPAAVNPLGVQVPIVPPSPQPQSQTTSTPPYASTSMPQTSAQPQPAAQEKPTAVDLIGKLANNDPNQMQQLLAQLKDSDKRNQFAQALGVIADTFGNMGMAKAGQRPEAGFATQQAIAQMGQKQRENALQNMNLQLESDPNSQTSKMAQQTLMQAMGIKHGDPREAAILKMPAQSITQIMPQMNEAVKNNTEKERNLIEAQKTQLEEENKKLQIQIAGQQAARAEQTARTQAAADVLGKVGIMSNIGGPDVREAAKNTLMETMGGTGTQQPPITATNKMGHRIVSKDGGKTWQPLQ